MAQFFPQTPFAGTPQSELRVLTAFRQLDDKWRVFHSVRWQSNRAGRPGDGEADIILLNRSVGVIVLEIKGGSIAIDNGTWFSTSQSGRKSTIRNPFEQAVASKYALIAYLSNVKPTIAGVPVTHGVVFPSVPVSEAIGMFGPRDIIVDCNDLDDSAAAISRLVDHWKQAATLSQYDVERVSDLLAPTVTIRRALAEEVRDSRAKLIELTKAQVRALSQMRLIRRAVVLGGAGTGKTLLAREKARRLAKDGFRTLFLCYNNLLGYEMTNELRNVEGVTAATFHSVCMDQARRAGLVIPSSPSQEWWESQAPILLATAAKKNATQFDAVVVDEGQDFAKGWFEVLLGLCSSRTDSPFYMFADNHQDLYCRSWWCPEEWPRFMLDINCRNSRQISKRVCAVYGDEDSEVGADGPETAIIQVRWDRGGLDVVQHAVARLLTEERLRPDQIVVLSDSTAMVEELRSRVVEDCSFTSWSRRGVPVETISRFKGLEADTVVLMLSDELARDADRAKALCYVGLSRARSLLLIARSERISALGGLGS